MVEDQHAIDIGQYLRGSIQEDLEFGTFAIELDEIDVRDLFLFEDRGQGFCIHHFRFCGDGAGNRVSPIAGPGIMIKGSPAIGAGNGELVGKYAIWCILRHVFLKYTKGIGRGLIGEYLPGGEPARCEEGEAADMCADIENDMVRPDPVFGCESQEEIIFETFCDNGFIRGSGAIVDGEGLFVDGLKQGFFGKISRSV